MQEVAIIHNGRILFASIVPVREKPQDLNWAVGIAGAGPIVAGMLSPIG
jgi:hypothetical protein